jgi:hypothetical protein
MRQKTPDYGPFFRALSKKTSLFSTFESTCKLGFERFAGHKSAVSSLEATDVMRSYAAQFAAGS